MSQPQNPTNLRKEFRIGSCNFSLESCRWKPVHLKQKVSENDFLSNKHHFMRIPNIRINQTSVLMADHIYMFGGCSQGIHDETFCAINLKNNRWHELKLKSNPSPRDSHGMAILKHEIYMFGGSNKERYFNDLYTFNNFQNEWKHVENKSLIIPQPRDQMIFISVKNQYLLLVGGINLQSQQKYFEDSFMWKEGEWKELKSNCPQNLILSRAVEINGRVFMFGGVNRATNEYRSTLYEIVVDEQGVMLNFKEVKVSIEIFPEGRINHELIPINNQYFMLIGGQKLNNKIFRDIWVFDLLTLRWTRIEPTNGPIKEIHSFSAVPYNNTIYLIGGFLQNHKQINQQVFSLQFANQQIFKSQICQNCVLIPQKKQLQNKKFPKDVMVSVGFMYNLALQIKFPFHAISMIYQVAKYFIASYFRIESLKTINDFNYLKIEFDGLSFGREEFLAFVSHNFGSSQLKKITEYIKLGAFRLGKTFLLVTSDKRFKYVYLLSAESRVSPHFDQAYIYYSYIQNMQLQRIQTEQGMKQRQLILNILKTHLKNPQIILESQQKTIMLIFQNKVVMNSERDYIYQLEGKEDDIKVWKSEKKVEFLEERGYKIQDELEISLKKWFMFYHLEQNLKKIPSVFINESEQPVPFLNYNRNILQKLQQRGIIYKVSLPPTDNEIHMSGQIYITSHPHFIEHNYGLLIYSKGLLYARYDIDFGRLFPQHFYKSKYKKAKTIFYEMGYINVEKGLEENFFRNGFNKPDKYASLLEKIKEKCEEKRQEVLEKHHTVGEKSENEDQQSRGGKKVKLA